MRFLVALILMMAGDICLAARETSIRENDTIYTFTNRMEKRNFGSAPKFTNKSNNPDVYVTHPHYFCFSNKLDQDKTVNSEFERYCRVKNGVMNEFRTCITKDNNRLFTAVAYWDNAEENRRYCLENKIWHTFMVEIFTPTEKYNYQPWNHYSNKYDDFAFKLVLGNYNSRYVAAKRKSTEDEYNRRINLQREHEAQNAAIQSQLNLQKQQRPKKLVIGARLCQTSPSGTDFIGFTEAYSAQSGKIKIQISSAKSKHQYDYQVFNQVVWDNPDTWQLCE